MNLKRSRTAGRKRAQPVGTSDGPPPEEGDAPAAGVGVPVEGGEVGGDERDPDEQAAEGDVLRGAVIADVGAAQAEAEEGLGGEDDPGDA